MTKLNNFGDLSPQHSNPDTAGIAIIPVPYDQTSTWIKGADKGPAAILEASANMELYDIETDSQVYKLGIFTDQPVEENYSPENMIAAVEQKTSHHLGKNKFTVVLGGEHSVSIGSMKAHTENYNNMTILQLDAHADLRDEYNNSKYNHACVMARAKQLAPILQVGIRSISPSAKDSPNKDDMFLAQNIYNNTAWIERAVSRLSDNVYITIDLDVFDPSIMPSTGTPEPGGLLWYDVLTFLRTVFQQKNVTGVDVVELCPNPANKAPDFLAAKLIYKMLTYKFKS